MNVLMVCLGNICRSPMAEGILKAKALKHNIIINVDSAGFEPFHVGDPPDIRAAQTALKHGIDISTQKARLFKYSDFKKFDKIFVMDNNNYSDVLNVAKTEDDKNKVDFILNLITPSKNIPVPDPYYGGLNGFENVFNLIDAACDKLIENLENK